MIFSYKNLIPAAAFAAVASVAVSAPAQALSLTGSVLFDDVTVLVTEAAPSTEDGDAAFAFPLGDADQAFSTGSFVVPNGVTPANDGAISIFGPLVISGGALSSTANPFLQDIDSDQGALDFVLTSISSYMEDFNGGGKAYAFSMKGYFTDGLGTTFAGAGVFDGRIIVDGNGGIGKFGGTLTAVPTPAAVLPVLAGLFGAASKRKGEGEEA
ncbi:MAG: PTPA-CTERM sorting domain-containing protein [Limnothrix sp. RL_2_0]|nr:PTPA-CTERM sorting domain-containing protein [Limnothrix sp. RL_2_0]